MGVARPALGAPARVSRYTPCTCSRASSCLCESLMRMLFQRNICRHLQICRQLPGICTWPFQFQKGQFNPQAVSQPEQPLRSHSSHITLPRRFALRRKSMQRIIMPSMADPDSYPLPASACDWPFQALMQETRRVAEKLSEGIDAALADAAAAAGVALAGRGDTAISVAFLEEFSKASICCPCANDRRALACFRIVALKLQLRTPKT
jgi:hypothetical protein